MRCSPREAIGFCVVVARFVRLCYKSCVIGQKLVALGGNVLSDDDPEPVSQWMHAICGQSWILQIWLHVPHQFSYLFEAIKTRPMIFSKRRHSFLFFSCFVLFLHKHMAKGLPVVIINAVCSQNMAIVWAREALIKANPTKKACWKV